MVIAGRVSHAFGVTFVVLKILLAVFQECSVKDLLLVDIFVGKLVQKTGLWLAVPQGSHVAQDVTINVG
jgi:hypothetical protein